MEPAVGLAAGSLGAVQAADREIARLTAVRARAVAEFAATRPASMDRPAGQPGCMSAARRAARPEVLAEVSEWAAQELAVALSISSTAAEALLTRSLTLVHRLPATLAALESQALHPGHLWPMLEKVAPIVDPKVRRQVETGLLGWAAGRVTTPAQLGAKARRMVLARDARGAAQRLAAALRRRGVTLRDGDGDVDGMAVLGVLATVPEAQALFDALGRYADAAEDEPGQPPRTRGQKMVDCLLDLVLRPGETDLPPVRAQWTVVAGVTTLAGGDQPGEIGGEPVPAEMIRSLARAFGLLPAPADLDRATGQDAEQAELDRWWAEVEERVLAEEWGGAEAAPDEELLRYWMQQPPAAEPDEMEDSRHRAPEDDAPDPEDDVPDAEDDAPAPAVRAPDPTDGVPDPENSAPDPAMSAGWWAAADAAVDELSGALWAVDVALGRARRAVERAEIADAADEADRQQSPSGRVSAADEAIAALAHLSADRRATLRHLLDATGGGGLIDRPRIAVTDALTGTLLALTDARELRERGTCGNRDCRLGRTVCDHDLSGRPGLGPPGECATYRPGAALDRHVRARDRRCRFPGCRRRVPLGGELDHNGPWPDGATSAGNLTGFCTSHHRGKHQAPGWQYDLAPDGTLTVTTPTGLVATTTPPPY